MTNLNIKRISARKKKIQYAMQIAFNIVIIIFSFFLNARTCSEASWSSGKSDVYGVEGRRKIVGSNPGRTIRRLENSL